MKSTLIKVISVVITLEFMLCCTHKNTIDFEQNFIEILGDENMVTLDFLINDFEDSFLRKQYPELNLNQAYKQFLIDVRDKKDFSDKCFSETSIQCFNDSKLNQDLYIYPDSVWILPNSTYDKMENDAVTFLKSNQPYLKKRYKTESNNESNAFYFERSYGNFNSGDDFDSIIDAQLKTPKPNNLSSYLLALEAIQSKSEFHKKSFIE